MHQILWSGAITVLYALLQVCDTNIQCRNGWNAENTGLTTPSILQGQQCITNSSQRNMYCTHLDRLLENWKCILGESCKTTNGVWRASRSTKDQAASHKMGNHCDCGNFTLYWQILFNTRTQLASNNNTDMVSFSSLSEPQYSRNCTTYESGTMMRKGPFARFLSIKWVINAMVWMVLPRPISSARIPFKLLLYSDTIHSSPFNWNTTKHITSKQHICCKIYKTAQEMKMFIAQYSNENWYNKMLFLIECKVVKLLNLLAKEF